MTSHSLSHSDLHLFSSLVTLKWSPRSQHRVVTSELLLNWHSILRPANSLFYLLYQQSDADKVCIFSLSLAASQFLFCSVMYNVMYNGKCVMYKICTPNIFSALAFESASIGGPPSTQWKCYLNATFNVRCALWVVTVKWLCPFSHFAIFPMASPASRDSQDAPRLLIMSEGFPVPLFMLSITVYHTGSRRYISARSQTVLPLRYVYFYNSHKSKDRKIENFQLNWILNDKTLMCNWNGDWNETLAGSVQSVQCDCHSPGSKSSD